MADKQTDYSYILSDLLEVDQRRPAFIFSSLTGETQQTITFGHLNQMVSAVAGGLRASGVKPKDSILICFSAGAEQITALLAAWRLGASVTVLEAGADTAWVEKVANTIDAKVILIDRIDTIKYLRSKTIRSIKTRIVSGSAQALGTSSFKSLLDTEKPQQVTEAVNVAADDIAMLVAFQAQNGDVKIERRTHGGIKERYEAMRMLWPELKDGLMWTTILDAKLHALSRGIALSVVPSRRSLLGVRSERPSDLHRLLNAAKVTIIVADIVTMTHLVQAPGRLLLPSVTHAVTGGDHVTPELLTSLKAVLPNAELATIFGSREAGAIGAAYEHEIVSRIDTLVREGGVYIGRISPSLRTRIIRVVDEQIAIENGSVLEDWEQAKGSSGELLVEVSSKEHDLDKSSIIVDEQGISWLRTRHIVRSDEHDGLWLLGHRGQSWKVRGKSMWALELESPAINLPQIESASVCMPRFAGKDREFKNASAVLVVKPAFGFTKDDALAAAESMLVSRGLDVSVEVRALSKIPTLKGDRARVDTEALHNLLRPENNEDY